MKYRYVIFDFDGTLVDTAALIVRTMQLTISALKLPERSDAECRAMIGYRLEEIPSILWQNIPDLAGRYVKTYREIFNSIKGSFEVRPFPHVIETLKELRRRGIGMAIASSRSKASLEDYCDDTQIRDCFSMLVGSGEVKNGKPAPDPVNLILDAQGWNREETLVVGDMDVDILMGKSAGTDTCGVTYGNGSAAALKEAGADYIISDFAKLIPIVSGKEA